MVSPAFSGALLEKVALLKRIGTSNPRKSCQDALAATSSLHRLNDLLVMPL